MHLKKIVFIDLNGQTTLPGQLCGARGICRRDYLLETNSCTINPAFVLDLIESLWAHSAKATMASNNKPNTI